jgi:hypothetical protein
MSVGDVKLNPANPASDRDGKPADGVAAWRLAASGQEAPAAGRDADKSAPVRFGDVITSRGVLSSFSREELAAIAGTAGPVSFVTPADDMQHFRPPGISYYSKDAVALLKQAYQSARTGQPYSVTIFQGSTVASVIAVPEGGELSENYFRWETGLNLPGNPFPEPLRHQVALLALHHEGWHPFLKQRHHDSEYGPDAGAGKSAGVNEEVVQDWLGLRALGLVFRSPEDDHADDAHHEWAGMLRPTDRDPERNRDEEFAGAEADILTTIALRMQKKGFLELTAADGERADRFIRQQSGAAAVPELHEKATAFFAFDRARRAAASVELHLLPGKADPRFTVHVIDPKSGFVQNVVETIVELNKADEFRAVQAEQAWADNFSHGAKFVGIA